MDVCIYTNDQIEFLQKHRSSMTLSELTRAFNATYGQNRSCFGIRNVCLKHNFKAVRTRRKSEPLGSEHISCEGYIRVKIAAPHTRNGIKWRGKHVLVWEAAHGLVPEGFCIAFADGNKRNCSLDNLIKVSRAEMANLNRYKLWSSDAELTRSAVNIVKLKGAIRDREKTL